MICEICGFEMDAAMCKIRCRNCGATIDCSDYIPPEKKDENRQLRSLGNKQPKENDDGKVLPEHEDSPGEKS